MKNTYDLFINSNEVNNIVKHYAYKISWRYRTLWDRDDAVNEIWCRLLKHVKTYYVPDENVVEFTRKKVFSIYGNLVDINKNNLNNEYASSYCIAVSTASQQPTYTPVVYKDFQHNLELFQFVYDSTLPEDREFTDEIHCNILLDQIEIEIKNCSIGSERSKNMALKLFRDLREGHTVKTASYNNDISESNAFRLFKIYLRELIKNFDNLSIETI